jgi:hypothetical protein
MKLDRQFPKMQRSNVLATEEKWISQKESIDAPGIAMGLVPKDPMVN